MYFRIICLIAFTATAVRTDDGIVFPGEYGTRLSQLAPVSRHIYQQDLSGQQDTSPSVAFNPANYRNIHPPGYGGNPCYYNRPNVRCSPLSSLNDNAKSNDHYVYGNTNSNSNAHANSNANGNGGSVHSNAGASSHNEFGNSNAQAHSQHQENNKYDNYNDYSPYDNAQNHGSASSASSAASASSGIVNGVPVAASSASAAAAGSNNGRGGYGGSSSASASASASGSLSEPYGYYRKINRPWFYASRIGGTDDKNDKNDDDTRTTETIQEEKIVFDDN